MSAYSDKEYTRDQALAEIHYKVGDLSDSELEYILNTWLEDALERARIVG